MIRSLENILLEDTDGVLVELQDSSTRAGAYRTRLLCMQPLVPSVHTNFPAQVVIQPGAP